MPNLVDNRVWGLSRDPDGSINWGWVDPSERLPDDTPGAGPTAIPPGISSASAGPLRQVSQGGSIYGLGENYNEPDNARDPYAAFNARFQKEYGRPITQDELNSNGDLVDKLGISNDLFRLLPLDRQMAFPSKRLALLDQPDLKRLIEFNPQVAGGFPTSFWRQFSNDWLAQHIIPFFQKANPDEAANIIRQNRIGGVGAGALPPEQQPRVPGGLPGAPSAGVPAPVTTPGNTPGPGTAPAAGGYFGARDERFAIPRLQQQGGFQDTGQSPLDIYYQLAGLSPPQGQVVNGQVTASRTIGNPLRTGEIQSPNFYDPLTGGEPRNVPATPPPSQPPPSQPPTGQPPYPAPSGQTWTFTYEPSTIPGLEPKITWHLQPAPREVQPRGNSTSVLIGGDLLREKTQADIDRTNQQIAASQAAMQAAQDRNDLAQERFHKLELERLQLERDRLVEQQRQFGAGQTQQQSALEAQLGLRAGEAVGFVGGQPTLQREVAVGESERANMAALASRAIQAAQIALRQGDQDEARRQFNIAQDLKERAYQFDVQKDPASFLQKVYAARGASLQAPTSPTYPGQRPGYTLPEGAPTLQAPRAQGNVDFPSSRGREQAAVDFQSPGGYEINQSPYQPPSGYGQGPLSFSEINQSPYQAPGLRDVFSDRAPGGFQSQAPMLSQQRLNSLLPSERQMLGSELLATGTNPQDYEQETRRLSQTGTPPRITRYLPPRRPALAGRY